ncbi:MAG: class B sortase [Lachnospiraceae bacterium]|jgi:sortase B|nr:class B sortase [Lachnospiraceae bacterium]
MKKVFLALKLCLVAVLVFGLVMIFRQNQEDRDNLASLADAVRIAGLSQRERDAWEEGGFGGENASTKAVEENVERVNSAAPCPNEIREQPIEQLPDEAAVLAALQLDRLQEVNDEVVGWIMIPGTEVSCPVLFGEDNQFYLTHDWKKEKSSSGAVFLECELDPALNDFHTIIYGHRMRSGAMFGSLKYYENPEYRQEHSEVYVAVEDGIYRYEIFAAYEAGLEDLVYRLNLVGREERFLSFCLEKSVISTGIIPTASDRILTMSTCTANNHDRRWVVQGRLNTVYVDRDGED